MLVLSRFPSERVFIITPDGTQLIIQAVEYRQGRMKLGFEAPKGYVVHREEVLRAIQKKDAQ